MSSWILRILLFVAVMPLTFRLGGNFTYSHLGAAEGLDNQRVFSVKQSGSGAVWWSTMMGAYVNQIVTVEGRLLFCAREGVYDERGKLLLPYNTECGYYDELSSKLWLGGYENGLHIITFGQKGSVATAIFRHMANELQSLSNDNVTHAYTTDNGLLKSHDGRIWIATDQGLAFVIAQQWNQGVVGWNLGNQFECSAPGQDGESMLIGMPDNSIKAETAWGNPVVTKKTIKAVKDAGFNAIRIPIRWQCHITNPMAMSIDKAWIARIKEVVDWCLQNDLKVIINTHHENMTYYCRFLVSETKKRGFSTFVWDNNAFGSGSEHFGIFDRNKSMKVVADWTLTGIMEGVRGER